jgi:hypothetical protein
MSHLGEVMAEIPDRNEIGLKARINSLPRQPKPKGKTAGLNAGVEVRTGCLTRDRSLW